MNKTKLINLVGFVLFAVGTTYALMTHELHQQLPFFASYSHVTHVSSGGAVMLLSIVVFVSAEKLRKRSAAAKKAQAV